MSTPHPKYIYKLIPLSPSTASCASTTIPIDSHTKPTPPTFPLPKSPLDTSSGFIHLCTHSQIIGVITRFMRDFDRIWLLQIDLDAGSDLAPEVGGKGYVKWEGPSGGGHEDEDSGEEMFPHLYPPGDIVGGKWALWERKKGGVVPEEDGAEWKRAE